MSRQGAKASVSSDHASARVPGWNEIPNEALSLRQAVGEAFQRRHKARGTLGLTALAISIAVALRDYYRSNPINLLIFSNTYAGSVEQRNGHAKTRPSYCRTSERASR
jgi:hypothetical protein